MLTRLCLCIFLFLPTLIIGQTDQDAQYKRFRSIIRNGNILIDEAKYQASLDSADLAEKVLNEMVPRPDSLKVHLLTLRGSNHLTRANYSKAKKYFEEAAVLLEQQEGRKETLAKCYNNIGNIEHRQGKHHGAIYFYEKSSEIYKQHFGKNHIGVAKAFLNIGVIYAFRNRDYSNGILYFEKALGIFEANENNYGVILCHSNLGEVYLFQHEYEKCKRSFEKEYELSLKTYGRKSKRTSKALANLGTAKTALGKHDEAINHYLAALDIALQFHDEKHPTVGVLYAHLGATYFYKSSFQKALTFTDKYIKHVQQQDIVRKIDLSNAYGNMSMILDADRKYTEALDYSLKAIAILENELDIVSPDKIGNEYLNLSALYLSVNDLVQAEKYAKQSLDYFNRYPKNAYDKIRGYAVLAEVCRKSKKYKEGDAYFEKIFALFASENGGNLQKFHSSKGLLFKTMNRNAKLYADWGKATNDLERLNTSMNFFSESFKVYEAIRKDQSHADSKSNLSRDVFGMYEDYISLTYDLYQRTQDPKYIEQIFNLSEKSKSFILFESLQKTNALQFAGIPDTLLFKENTLQLKINALTKRRESLLLSGIPETNPDVLALSSRLFELEKDYMALENYFGTNFPDYFQLKFDLNTIKVGQVQQQLISSNQTLIEYFVGEQSIFICVINQDQSKVFEVEKDFPLEDWIKSFRIANEKNNFHSEVGTYCEVAHQLYEKLIAPVAGDLKEELIIIPDGVLGYLPFEALLVVPVSKVQRFKKHHYLIRDKQISYSYSATLLQQMQEKKHKQEASESLLAFAPFFEGDTAILASTTRFVDEDDIDLLNPLPGTGEEVYGVQKIIGGDVFYHQEATEDNFTARAADYQVLHLATHGKANDKSGNFSYIAFTVKKDSLENEILYMRDLYDLQLNADMVVLSACETGIGELQKGEGIVSLARGFTYAGAKSIITSLWSVEDERTKDIMISFYEYLKAGKNKDAALRQAKLDFINDEQNTHVDVHPFYWSGFIGIGDMSRLELK